VEKKLPDALAEALAGFPTPRPLRLMFQDEARFGRISDCCYCWCPKPLRPVVRAMLTHQYVFAYAAVSPVDGRMDSLVLPHVNGDCMQRFLTEIASRYPSDNIVMILDGASWHRNQQVALPPNVRLLFLPPYSPELNPVEHLWDDVREKHFHNRAFDSLDALEDQLVIALQHFEADPSRVHSITAWAWIITAASNAN